MYLKQVSVYNFIFCWGLYEILYKAIHEPSHLLLHLVARFLDTIRIKVL